ncbi:serine/threonine-protein phosphatase 2A regulatory subunit B'' subunit beta-like isoform X2 [Gigantopelta aegis]|uniref:serine/threonine-protein phosphatase 2A regulatory subunit B'' subunit beta-like isoform X2 n=1 Tax=Gigantopelta aegis TaxID=1735272 RepID=UPI001B88754B|nr:serine/threonine-protein phosphatase 2A regulatory subunit B'' subunit beta-like isoform X2 [Gigantopelta aegis]
MQKKYACVKLVHSRVTLYYSSKIDLRWRRSLHHCQSCKILGCYGVKCGAIHYGICSAIAFPFFLGDKTKKTSPATKSQDTRSRLPQNKSDTVSQNETDVTSPRVPQSDSNAVSHLPESETNVPSPRLPQTETNTISHIPQGETNTRCYRPQSETNTISRLPQSETNVLSLPQGAVIQQPAVASAKERETLPGYSLEKHVSDKSKYDDISKTVQDTPPFPNCLEDKENKQTRQVPVPRTSFRNSSVSIPKFYFPKGRPVSVDESDTVLQSVAQEFASFEHGKAYKQQMGVIAKACGLPFYWKSMLFHASGGRELGFITLQAFTAMWRQLVKCCHDQAAKFVHLLGKSGCHYLQEDDFMPLIQDVVDAHPGLSFLQEAPEFHSRYVNTVISRIFFCVNRSWSGRITATELRKSNFLRTLALLEDEEDINQVSDYFSYEHFYVIYCKFWELDQDHDLFISKSDLSRHNEHALSTRVIDRIFSGAVTRGPRQREGRMSYPEFVWFLIAEEDKKNPTSIEYWFRCMDLDGDGVISMYEMEYFYEEQMQKMESMGIEKLPFEDCLCQMLDMVRPRQQGQITLSDLKACKMTDIFFDTFFNLDKFLEHEQRDPFANIQDPDSAGTELSDWEKYAAEEYEILVAEEGANELEEIHYEDDFEPDDDDLGDEMIRLADPPQRKVKTNLQKEDIYDFSSNSLGY